MTANGSPVTVVFEQVRRSHVLILPNVNDNRLDKRENKTVSRFSEMLSKCHPEESDRVRLYLELDSIAVHRDGRSETELRTTNNGTISQDYSTSPIRSS